MLSLLIGEDVLSMDPRCREDDVHTLAIRAAFPRHARFAFAAFFSFRRQRSNPADKVAK